MTKQRERFEAFAIDFYDVRRIGGAYSSRETEESWRSWKTAEAQAMERCAKRCDDYSVDRWRLFKGQPPYAANDVGCADLHTQGESDGAESCAELIRAMMKE